MSQRLAGALQIEDIYAFAADPALALRLFPRHTVRVHSRGLTTLAREHWQWLLPLIPGAWRSLDLSDYRLVVTSSHACTNAIRVAPGAYHVSYCHSPMRYAWDWRLEIRRLPGLARPGWPAVAAVLRQADRRWSRNVTLFMANSRNVSERIRRYYRRASVVVHPPVPTDFWAPADQIRTEGFFLYAGRLVPYKRPDVAVRAANLAGVRLVVAGSGPDLRSLQRVAGPKVEFVLDPSNEELRDLYRRSEALVFPGVEDFGMTMVEAQACGTPVVAFAAGGALESVRPGITGLLYSDPSPQALAEALRGFRRERFSTDALRRNALRFDSRRFDTEIRAVIAAVTGESVRVAATDEFAQRLQQDLDVERK